MKLVEGWLAEPLVHFLLAGGALFLAASWWDSGADEERTIHVGRNDLLVFMQRRAQVYDEKRFSALLDAMPAAQKNALVREAASQEALYREGRALGLARADPLIRQRLVQQMRLLLSEEAAAHASVSRADVEAWYRDHRADYLSPAQASFTHVFFSEAGHGSAAEATAQTELQRLRRQNVSFEGAGRHGERFLYQLNYIDTDEDVVASHFGKGFAQRLFALEPGGGWQGPIHSDRGWHLVLLRGRSEESLPALADIADRVREDALADKRNHLARAALDRLLERYQVVPEAGLGK